MSAANVIAAIVGGVLVLILEWFWKEALPTVIIRFQKNEPNISGKWKTTFVENDKDYHENVSLKQRGRKVFATIILKDDDEEIIYDFKGTFQNLILSGTYICTDDANFERGSILLRYVKKDKFVGQNSFFSKTSSQVVSSSYTWHHD